MPVVSVVLPVRNGASYLDQALRSVLDQTHRDLELVVVDDGSTDETPELLERAAQQDSRLRVLHHERSRGVAGALNTGLAQARSPLLARMDADDISDPRRLALQVQLLEARPDVGVCGTATRHIDAHGRRLPALLTTLPLEPAGVRLCLAAGTPFAHPTVVARTALLRERGGYDEQAPLEDLDLWLRCADVDMVNLPEPLLLYRLHGRNTTGSARARGAAKLAGRHAAHAAALLGESVLEPVSHLVLNPRASGGADADVVAAALHLLDRLVDLAERDRPAVLDRALSTAAVLLVTRARSRQPLPALSALRHLTRRRLTARLGRGAWVGACRTLASR